MRIIKRQGGSTMAKGIVIVVIVAVVIAVGVIISKKRK